MEQMKTVSQKFNHTLKTEQYLKQCQNFPQEGRHIMCHQNEKSLVVYQAFNKDIAEYAIKNQKFGGENYSFNRMSWIKPNFLWMMYRSDWAQKKGQEKILAIWISKENFFNNILHNAYSVKRQQREKIQDNKKGLDIRLQWDPDYDPNFKKQNRRAIQLGLRSQELLNFSDKYIEKIEDITGFVKEQEYNLRKFGVDQVEIPIETELIINDQILLEKLDMI
ncbi:hypothetical protein PPERSA_08938 [Pseudocohnilembus persalinus]|uniref:DUF4291 domain-containing protein n=1 Tax=Pseudocohnilembus persalinus TaxID=266149 RepID=A0A0V0R2V3_PSEPJ|nr:hypothetical protein PPERSA_08938 [Pseudocohnilembus persalinus]|eukprot:KRX08834.1 hypothetical protein PPERSA_08938 [Pseudocohnilembus persalinus]